VASYILPDGTLEAGSAIWTQGNGSAGINDPEGYENHVSFVLLNLVEQPLKVARSIVRQWRCRSLELSGIRRQCWF